MSDRQISDIISKKRQYYYCLTVLKHLSRNPCIHIQTISKKSILQKFLLKIITCSLGSKHKRELADKREK